MTRLRNATVAVLMAAAVLSARPALAGPPLICFPFEIGNARTLPMGTNGWHDTDPKYDVSRLVDDTVGLLAAETPVIVRMETLRRATMYAGKNPTIAAALLARLEARAKTAQPDAALSVFDFGYLIETYRQAAPMFKSALPAVDTMDGYGLVQKAFAFRNDPEIEFAAAVITAYPRTKEHDQHLRRATAAAQSNSRIAANLATHFTNRGQ